MNRLRRWLALLLIALLPLPAWASAAHCAGLEGVHAAHSGVTEAHATHGADTTAGAHIDSDVADSTSESVAEHSGSERVSPCCSAVLPAPTCGQGSVAMSATVLAAPATHFASADRVPLKRPPKHSRA